MKYIFVTGGVVSGLGKGICAASLGRLLKQYCKKYFLRLRIFSFPTNKPPK